MVDRRALRRKAALEKGAQERVEGLHSCNRSWRRGVEKLACKVPSGVEADQGQESELGLFRMWIDFPRCVVKAQNGNNYG